MYESERQLWLQFVETFIGMRLLWDQKHEHYSNKLMRNEAYEKLLKIYRKIEEDATVPMVKRKIDNMRTSYNREKRKVKESLEKGEDHMPSLWYYDHFCALDAPRDDSKHEVTKYNTVVHLDKKKNFNRSRESILSQLLTAPTTTPRTSKRLKRNTQPDEDTETQPQPKRRIYHLLDKQEKFVDSASKMLADKNSEWEVQGKAIGLQLHNLDRLQKTIANKLISDVIYYGNMGKLSTDSYVHIEDYQELLPEFEKEVNLETEENEDEDDSPDSKESILLVERASSCYDDDDEDGDDD